jgi:hypothetical protein
MITQCEVSSPSKAMLETMMDKFPQHPTEVPNRATYSPVEMPHLSPRDKDKLMTRLLGNQGKERAPPQG